MSDERQEPLLVSERQALLALVLVSVGLAMLVILPYLSYILLAIVLAYVLWPLQLRLEDYLTSAQAALVLTTGTVIALLLPIGYFLLLAVREGRALLRAFERGDINVVMIERQLAEWGIGVDLEQLYLEQRESIVGAVRQLGESLFGMIRSLPRVFIGLTITLFVLFVLLRDGEKLLRWFGSVTPLRDEVQSEFLERLDRLMWASVLGNVAASAIQAVALGIGLAVLGFDSVVLLTLLTFILALLPLVGAFGVWVPLVAYLAVLGRPQSAALLFVWGSLVSVSDFYTRPLVIGKSAALNSAIIVVGVFGGLIVFGMMGLFIGPVVLGGTKITIEILARERAEGGDIFAS